MCKGLFRDLSCICIYRISVWPVFANWTVLYWNRLLKVGLVLYMYFAEPRWGLQLFCIGQWARCSVAQTILSLEWTVNGWFLEWFVECQWSSADKSLDWFISNIINSFISNSGNLFIYFGEEYVMGFIPWLTNLYMYIDRERWTHCMRVLNVAQIRITFQNSVDSIV